MYNIQPGAAQQAVDADLHIKKLEVTHFMTLAVGLWKCTVNSHC